MAQILIRQLDDEAKERLKERAERNGRSLEAEAREILEGGGRARTHAKKVARPASALASRDDSRESVSRNRSWQSSIG